ncbi:MAG: hypothetical protein SNJ57_02825 [Cyanobacteriota bacterium]
MHNSISPYQSISVHISPYLSDYETYDELAAESVEASDMGKAVCPTLFAVAYLTFPLAHRIMRNIPNPRDSSVKTVEQHANTAGGKRYG